MSFETWVAFAFASAALLAIPGPTVMLVVSYALGRGRASGWATVPGVALGDLTAMTVSLLGAGAILAASSTLFTILKLMGAAYLVWLGIKLWRSSPHQIKEGTPVADKNAQTYRSMFWNSYIVTTLNPKGIIFFIAFVPQFIDPTQPVFSQFAILEATFVTLATINITIWAVLAGQMRERFKNPVTLNFINKIGGSFLIGAGFLTATLRNNS